MKEAGLKYDIGKARLDLIPAKAEIELGNVLTFGANKYAENSWQNVDDAINRYTAAAMRHINAMRQGETHDLESGLLHSAHAACNMMFVTELINQG